MSISEIVEEPPKLSAEERDAVRLKLLEYDRDPRIDGAWQFLFRPAMKMTTHVSRLTTITPSTILKGSESKKSSLCGCKCGAAILDAGLGVRVKP